MKNKIPFRIKCNMCGKLFRSGNDPKTGLPNGVGFQLEDGSIYNMCSECICKVGEEQMRNEPTIRVNHEDNNSCRTCFFNDKGFCRLKYFTIYDDSYGCDLYSKMKDDNI